MFLEPPEDDNEFMRWFIGVCGLKLAVSLDRACGAHGGKYASIDMSELDKSTAAWQQRYNELLP